MDTETLAPFTPFESINGISASTMDYNSEGPDTEGTTVYAEAESTSGIEASVVNPYWYQGPYFYPIHITAISSLVISIIASIGVIVYQKYHSENTFWKRPIGDRLVVYLAICDLLFSVCHLADHSSIAALKWYPPPAACEALGFLTVTFIVAQQLLILYTAINALLVVGFRRRFSLGRYDWRLLTFTFVTPVAINAVGLGLRWYGPGSVWCLVNFAKPNGLMISQAYSMFTVATFIANGVIYAAVWVKISRDVRLTSGYDISRYARTAKIMSVCVIAAMFQWTPGFIQTLWRLWGMPHPFLVMATVFNTNVGGLINCFAYTVIRVRFRQQADTSMVKPERKEANGECGPENPRKEKPRAETVEARDSDLSKRIVQTSDVDLQIPEPEGKIDIQQD